MTLAPADIPEGGISVLQLLVRAGLAGSGKDARRLIAEGGARLDDVALTDAGLHLDAAELAPPASSPPAASATRWCGWNSPEVAGQSVRRRR